MSRQIEFQDIARGDLAEPGFWQPGWTARTVVKVAWVSCPECGHINLAGRPDDSSLLDFVCGRCTGRGLLRLLQWKG